MKYRVSKIETGCTILGGGGGVKDVSHVCSLFDHAAVSICKENNVKYFRARIILYKIYTFMPGPTIRSFHDIIILVTILYFCMIKVFC